MKIEEAITVLEDELRENAHREGSWLEDAHKLSIEALKWIKWRRENYCQPPILPLPGETK